VYYADGTIEWKRNIAGVGQITQKVTTTGALVSEQKQYFLKDHLGSISVIMSDTAEVLQKMAFDPWGARRDLNSIESMTTGNVLAYYAKAAKPITSRGFTGHEMVDAVGIIHMNGRIYDAKLGRFLQADPFVQEPTMVGSLNRYSYIMNNPLNGVDPSGFNWVSDRWHASKDDIKPYAGLIVGTLLVIATGGASAAAFAAEKASWFVSSWYGAAALGGISGAVGSGVNGGNVMKGALFGAVSGAAFYGVGSMFADGGSLAGLQSGIKELVQGGMHGVTGGILADLQGGQFGHGFVSAGIAKGVSLGAAALTRSVSVQFVAAALAGGTASKMTGGKFANGAQSAAIAFVANQLQSLRKSVAQKDETEQQRMERLLNNVYEDYPELKKLNIQVRAVDDIDGAVGLYQGGRRIDIKAGLGDIGTQATIFHEALHVDESVATTLFEGKWEYGLKETLGPDHFMQHDPWIDKAGSQYQHYLNFNGRLPDVNKPDLNNAPWRK